MSVTLRKKELEVATKIAEKGFPKDSIVLIHYEHDNTYSVLLSRTVIPEDEFIIKFPDFSFVVGATKQSIIFDFKNKSDADNLYQKINCRSIFDLLFLAYKGLRT